MNASTTEDTESTEKRRGDVRRAREGTVSRKGAKKGHESQELIYPQMTQMYADDK
jgi:hypothetical protein